MSPWLFNLYIDGVVREVNARVLGRGLELIDANDNAWQLNQLLFADDTVVVADSEEKLCREHPNRAPGKDNRARRIHPIERQTNAQTSAKLLVQTSAIS